MTFNLFMFRTKRLWIGWMEQMLQPWPRKFNITQVLSPRLLLQKKNRTQNRFVPEVFYRFCSTLTFMLNSELSHVCYRSGKIQGKNISARLGEVREILPLWEKSGKSEILFKSCGGPFCDEKCWPFLAVNRFLQAFLFPLECVIQVTLWIKLLPFSWFWMFHILCYILWT